MTEWSAEATVPAGLAERALRRRVRRRVRAVALATGAAAAVAAVAVTADLDRNPTSPPASRPTPADTSLHADPAHSPPVRLVAAGRIAMSAYYVTHRAKNGVTVSSQRTWYVYDPASDRYRETSWAYLAVAPGLRQAAVLEGPLPAARVGLLDTRTRKVTRWIPLDRRAGGLAWSADGRRLLVTAYGQNPDLPTGPRSSTRIGFYVVDAKTGRPGPFRALPPDTDNFNTRQDLGWSRTGALIWSPTGTVPTRTFYDLQGRPQATLPHEADSYQEAGLSADGRYIAMGNPGSGPGPLTAVKDVTTGRTAGLQPVEQLRAWADDGHLIALACQPKGCTGKGEFYNRLVLVSVDGKEITPLTGYQHSDRSGSWIPVFTPR
ncbi:YncE family protein [Actinoallomurus rhizosphaericola]|uniref:YncE family protein n=1 Tax=Actinoallomurus rhizosphaericola TaxID=2952536 RepID=UPI002092E428|nr:hypothetical protein [Actinoallomurus rhizosphaericola]MCO5995094.1 hypothetical protein [Actinoallomurus rhizosphaericola]